MVAVCKICDVVFKIEYRYDFTFKILKDYLYDGEYSEFETIEISDKDIDLELSFSNGDASSAEHLAILRKMIKVLLLKYNAVVFHGSAIKYNDKGFVFTAPSGTGKSTHTALLKKLLEDKVSYVNDDKPIIRVVDNVVYLYGSPWNGKHYLGENVKVKLEAICLLTRGETNVIKQISPEVALKYLLKQTVNYDSEDSAQKLFSVISKTVNQARLYAMACTKDISSAKCSFEGIMYED